MPTSNRNVAGLDQTNNRRAQRGSCKHPNGAVGMEGTKAKEEQNNRDKTKGVLL